MRKTRGGFTILELGISGFMVVVVVAAVLAFTYYFLRSYSFSFEANGQINMASTAMSQLLREIREARNGDDGSWPLVTVEDNSLVFFSDVTNDGRSDKVRYFLSGTELKKGVIEPTAVPVTYPASAEVVSTVAYSVDNDGKALFTYYNGDWPGDDVNNPLPLSSRLLGTRFVNIYLRINVTDAYGAAPFEMNSGVSIVSLKDNL